MLHCYSRYYICRGAISDDEAGSSIWSMLEREGGCHSILLSGDNDAAEWAELLGVDVISTI